MINQGYFSINIIRGDQQYLLDNADIIELNIVEDIYSICMFGDIIMYDKVGWTEQMEMFGFDPIGITYQGNGKVVNKIFMVYNYQVLTEESQLDTGIQKIKWFLVEPTFFKIATRRFSKAWGENILGSTIVKDICTNLGFISNDEWAKDNRGNQMFENTNETFDNFYIPYWTPIESIRWLMKRCSGENSDLPGYFFYSNSRGFNFITIDSLVTSKDRELDKDGTLINYFFTGNNDSTYKILNWYVNPPDQTSLEYLSGSRRYGFSYENKEIINETYNYESSIKNYNIMGLSTLFGNEINDSRRNINTEGETTSDQLFNIHNNDFIKRYMKQLSVGLVVLGCSDRYAGMLINVNWKSSNSNLITNKMLEGLYLVKGITHQFTSGMVTQPYRQLLTCVKNGYGQKSQSIPKQLLDASKTITNIKTVTI